MKRAPSGAVNLEILAVAFVLVTGHCTAATLQQPVFKPQQGNQVYQQHCAACHGATGDGNGPASVWLFPKPRNFSAGMFKIQSTPPGSPPSDEDLFQTVTRG